MKEGEVRMRYSTGLGGVRGRGSHREEWGPSGEKIGESKEDVMRDGKKQCEGGEGRRQARREEGRRKLGMEEGKEEGG